MGPEARQKRDFGESTFLLWTLASRVTSRLPLSILQGMYNRKRMLRVQIKRVTISFKINLLYLERCKKSN